MLLTISFRGRADFDWLTRKMKAVDRSKRREPRGLMVSQRCWYSSLLEWKVGTASFSETSVSYLPIDTALRHRVLSSSRHIHFPFSDGKWKAYASQHKKLDAGIINSLLKRLDVDMATWYRYQISIDTRSKYIKCYRNTRHHRRGSFYAQKQQNKTVLSGSLNSSFSSYGPTCQRSAAVVPALLRLPSWGLPPSPCFKQ